MSQKPPETPLEAARRAQSRRAMRMAAAIIVASLVAIGLYTWFELGDATLSASGYIALVLGIIGTVGLGVGLMALVFYSHRYGYDDKIGGGDDGTP